MPRRTVKKAKRKKTTTHRVTKHKVATSRPRTSYKTTAQTYHIVPRFTASWMPSETKNRVNLALDNFEHGLSETYTALSSWGGHKLMNYWHSWTANLSVDEVIRFARVQKTTLEHDLTYFTRNLTKAYEKTVAELRPNGNDLIKDARRNICEVYTRVKNSGLMSKAKLVANTGKEELFSMLNIPSQDEVETLQRKLNTLEHRVTSVMLRGAKNR